MEPKPYFLSLAAAGFAVIAIAAGLLASKDAPEPAAVEHNPRTPRERNPEKSASLFPRLARQLNNDDLLAICKRDGAAAALAAAKSQPWPDRDSRVGFILSQLAAENPEFAAAELNSAGLNTFLKASLVDIILKNWTDGRKALDWAENQLTGELHCKAVAGALGILVKTEPEAAFAYFEKMPPGDTRRQAIPELFAAWGSQDPRTALMQASALTPEDARSATEHLLRGWAKADPETAAAWLLKNAPTDVRWIARVYQSWASTSPEKARLWLDTLPEGDAKRSAPTLFFGSSGTAVPNFSTRPPDNSWSSKSVAERTPTDVMNWATQDTEGARSFLEQNENTPVSNQLAAQVARAISGKSGPLAAIDWALGLAEENGNRDQALWIVFSEWSYKDPEAASGKLASMQLPQHSKLPLSLVVNNWVKQDPAAAADWVMGWKGENQAIMIEKVIDKWPDYDPQAAYQWLGSLPAGAARDAGIKTMIRRERDSARDTLQPWIDLISDPKLREKTRRELE